MGCFKTLNLSEGGCAFETCSTTSLVSLSAPAVFSCSMGFAPDLCYCLVVAWSADTNTSYFFKFDPDSNTLISKGSRAGQIAPGNRNAPNCIVYEPVRQKFVMGSSVAEVVVFDPVAESISGFATGLGGIVQNLVWVAPRDKIYCLGGVGATAMAYIDLDISTVISVGAFWFTYTLCYAATTDSLYGAVSGGANPGLHRYNLPDNVVTTTVAGSVTASTGCCVDTGRNLLLAGLGNVVEVNLTTLAIERTTPVPAEFEGFRYNKFYDSGSNKMYCTGFDDATGNFIWIGSYLCASPYTVALVNDDESYNGMIQLSGLSVMTQTSDPSTEGFQRLCLT